MFTGAVNLRRARSPVVCSTLINFCQATPEVSKTPRYLDSRLPTPFIGIIEQFIMVASKWGLKRRSSSSHNTSLINHAAPD